MKCDRHLDKEEDRRYPRAQASGHLSLKEEAARGSRRSLPNLHVSQALRGLEMNDG